MRRTLAALTTKRLDGRSAVAVAVRRFMAEVEADLGGDLTRAQRVVLESAAQKLVLRDTLADFIFRQSNLVTRKRQLAPVVLHFLQVSDSLARDLERLGLERRAKPVQSLTDYVDERAREAAEQEAPEREGATETDAAEDGAS